MVWHKIQVATWRLQCSPVLASILQPIIRKQVIRKKELHWSLQAGQGAGTSPVSRGSLRPGGGEACCNKASSFRVCCLVFARFGFRIYSALNCNSLYGNWVLWIPQSCLQVPDTGMDEIEPYIQRMAAVPRSGLHNPFKNPERRLSSRKIVVEQAITT